MLAGISFSGQDWALIITALTGFLGMLGTQIAQLMVSLRNARSLSETNVKVTEANTKIDDAKVAAVEAKTAATQTKAVIDDVKTNTDGLTTHAIASALKQGLAEGNLVGRAEQTSERNKDVNR